MPIVPTVSIKTNDSTVAQPLGQVAAMLGKCALENTGVSDRRNGVSYLAIRPSCDKGSMTAIGSSRMRV
jgi:hypothetical protein